MRPGRMAEPGHGHKHGGNLSKYAPIFLVLALSGILLLLCNIHTLERWNCQSSLYQLRTGISPVLKPGAGPFLALDHNQTFCLHLGQEPSSEEAREERYVLDALAWPGANRPVGPVRKSSDPAHSYFVIQPPPQGSGSGSGSGQLGTWRVGGKLEVLVHMRDFLGQPKRHGGDFLLARIRSPELGAGASGLVVDRRDGLYAVELPLLWAGPAQVEVTLVHSAEAVRVLRRLREERPDRVFFKSRFRSGFLTETAVCNLCLPTGAKQAALCNYTDARTGEPWYCYKPRLLDCDTRVDHAKGGYKKNLLTTTESLLFSSFAIKAPVQAIGMDSITILPATNGLSSMHRDVAKFVPSGYYYQGSWRPLSFSGMPIMQQFNDPSAITQCLSGKLFYMFGDSTVRQWFEYLNAFVPELKEINLYSPKHGGPYMAVDSVNNILLSYRCHGPPIRFSAVSSELRYVANELDGLPGGRDTVVAISVWSHFSTFPLEVYLRRLRHVRRAVARLLDRAPGTLVVVRTANPQQLDPQISLYNSDWFSVQLDAVLRVMFKGLQGVVLLDAWDMTLAHPTKPHHVHPAPDIVKNMIDLILSHVCPASQDEKS